MEKQCSKCNEVKPISEFGKLSKSKDGLNYYCKVCGRQRCKNYYGNNIEKERERTKQKRLNNLEYSLNRSKKYYYENKESLKSLKKQWLDNNPNYYNDYYHSNKSNPEFRFGILVRKHLKGVSNRQEFKEIWDDVREVYDMYDIPYHIDHMVPKSWFLVRTPKYLINHLDNLQVIDADYNLSKLNRWSDPVPSDYLDKIRPYIKKKFEGLLKSL